MGDPYAVWVSEMMLQQTQVATVIPYYERWMARFPDVQALARAEEADVLHAWQGLGYYRRARSLLSGARQVVERHAGTIPRGIDELLALPGVGPYTAGAIASIAYGLPEPVVDGNVIRVLSRLFCLTGDPTQAGPRRELWALAKALVPEEAPGDFNQALMELGATTCTPQPRCAECPVSKRCLARRAGRELTLPALPPRAKLTHVTHAAALILRGEQVLVGRLAADAPRWSGMWQFPTVELTQPASAAALGAGAEAERAGSAARRRRAPEARGGEGTPEALAAWVKASFGLKLEGLTPFTSLTHHVTRYRISLEAYTCRAPRGAPLSAPPYAELRFVPKSALEALAMPKAQRALATRLSAAPSAEAPDGELSGRKRTQSAQGALDGTHPKPSGRKRAPGAP